MHGAADSRIYVQPLGFLRGCSAVQATDQGQACWLNGGRQQPGTGLAFTMIQVTCRPPSGLLKSHLMPVAALAAFAKTLPAHQQEQIEQQYHRMTRPYENRGTLVFRGRPLLQAVLNITPDSFSDGGQYEQAEAAIRQGHRLMDHGADILDIGGESTRPGATEISSRTEESRVLPVIKGLARCGVPLSIDSRHAAVMVAALDAGAHIINDVSALTHDARAMAVAAEADCPVILMHAQKSPDVMQDNPVYDHVVFDVYDYLETRIAACVAAGIDQRRLIIDPGIGFGKRPADNMALLRNLSLFHGLGMPLLLGVSRKSIIGHITGVDVPVARLPGSLALAQAAYDQGVQILRVHDVAESRQARDIWWALGENVP